MLLKKKKNPPSVNFRPFNHSRLGSTARQIKPHSRAVLSPAAHIKPDGKLMVSQSLDGLKILPFISQHNHLGDEQTREADMKRCDVASLGVFNVICL